MRNILSVDASFRYCEQLARDHYENFPVGSVLIPRRSRKHVYSIYAFARTADDFADEGYDGDISDATRLARLDEWQKKLEDSYRGVADDPVFIALSETVKELRLPLKLFEDLLSAFKQDVTKTRYRDFDEVLDYCSRSANPVGRLILLLFDYRDEKLHRMSDDVCTGLQLANFWQDVSIDIRKDRIYLPADEMAHYGVTEDDLRSGRFTERYASLMKYQVERTHEIFNRGRMLPGLVGGRLAVELRLTWLGGMRILERIEEQGYDTLRSKPMITSLDKIRLIVQSLLTR